MVGKERSVCLAAGVLALRLHSRARGTCSSGCPGAGGALQHGLPLCWSWALLHAASPGPGLPALVRGDQLLNAYCWGHTGVTAPSGRPGPCVLPDFPVAMCPLSALPSHRGASGKLPILEVATSWIGLSFYFDPGSEEELFIFLCMCQGKEDPCTEECRAGSFCGATATSLPWL